MSITAEMKKELVELRRDFHKFAESKWREFRTASKVVDYLAEIGMPYYIGEEISVKGMGFSYPDDETLKADIERAISQGANRETVNKMAGMPGVIGVLDTGKAGPIIAMRFDIDSLPFSELQEEGHIPYDGGYASVNEGCCHACGHDGHTAIGMVLAKLIMSKKDELCGKIKLIFQPGEEGGGGARGIVARGWLDDVTHLFVPHIGLTRMDGTPVLNNTIICGAGDFLDNRRYNVYYKGKASHPCGDPHNGKNALLAACSATMGIHSIPAHNNAPVFMYVGVLNSGHARNAVPSEAYMELEIRGANDLVADYGEKAVLNVVESAARMYGVESEVVLVGKTSSASCDEAAIDIIKEAAEEVAWFETIERYGILGGTDDAAEMMRKVQEHGGIAAYCGVGSDFTSSFHDRGFTFDEAVLAPTTELFYEIIKKATKK